MEDISNLFQLILDNIPARVFWKDRELVYQGANKLFLKDVGCETVEDLIGKTDSDFGWNDEQIQTLRKAELEVIENNDAKMEIIEPKNHIDGTIHWFQISKLPLRSDKNEVLGVLVIYTDVTEQKKYQLEIEHQAKFDELTELPNRRYLQEYINSRNNENKEYGGLLFIDLDHFKTVNDSLGHMVGDRLLRMVAERLKKTVDDKGIVTRLGGDEFSVLVYTDENPKKNFSNIKTLADQILTIFDKPYYINSHILYLGASIGITPFENQQEDASTKFKEADLAMYEAKSRGRSAYAFFKKNMREDIEKEHQIITQLRNAIDKEVFTLAYQPQFNAFNECVGVEALIRWTDRKMGYISPDQFIPIAEKTGLIHPIGNWVFEEAGHAFKRWRSSKNCIFKGVISINISAHQFRQVDFVQSVHDFVYGLQLTPADFELEITESLLLGNQEVALEKLNQLRKLGFSVAIDDFGTGYSSLSYLSRLPVDKLKIDRSFVTRMFKTKRDAKIVEMILQIARSLDIKTIAEGVENRNEVDYLVALGCNYFQGYFFERPMTEEALSEKDFFTKPA